MLVLVLVLVLVVVVVVLLLLLRLLLTTTTATKTTTTTTSAFLLAACRQSQALGLHTKQETLHVKGPETSALWGSKAINRKEFRAQGVRSGRLKVFEVVGLGPRASGASRGL